MRTLTPPLRSDWRDKAPFLLANVTFCLAGYAIGDILYGLKQLIAG